MAVARQAVALGDTPINSHAGTTGQAQQHDRSLRERHVSVGVFGTQVHCDRMAGRSRRGLVEATSVGNVELELHQIDPGSHLGDGVPIVESRSHTDERPGVALLDEEQNRARARAGCCGKDAMSVVAKDSIHRWREPSRLDQRSALTQADHHRGAVAIGDGVNLDEVRTRGHDGGSHTVDLVCGQCNRCRPDAWDSQALAATGEHRARLH